MQVDYARGPATAEEFRDVLVSSGLGERRPVDDLPRLQAMLDKADLVVTARDADTGRLLGIARSLTDFCFACYLSDLAVDSGCQGKGIGRKLLALTRELAGPQSMCLLLSAPGAVSFYEKIGMPRNANAFLYQREG